MKDILVAKTADDKLIYLTDAYNRIDLMNLRKLHKFYCPDCKSVLLLKIGAIKIPHFAHKSLSACGSSEPESAMHLQGKILLHQFFVDKKIPTEIEAYLPDIRQRADVLVDQHTAVEFQCSAISASSVSKRSHAYASLGINFTWIAGSNETRENCVQIIKLKEYQKVMLLHIQRSNYLILLNPKIKQFQYFSNLFYISGSTWVGKVSTLSLDKQTYPFATPKSLSRKEFDSVYTVFLNARTRFIKAQYFAKKRFQNPFWLLCYSLQLDMRNLPLTIGVPILGADCLVEHPIIWQLQMIRAHRDKVSCEIMISSGAIKIVESTDIVIATKVLTNYMEFLDKDVASTKDVSQHSEVLYDIYCKNVRKLRK